MMIAYLIHLYRMENKITVRQMAAKIGIGHTILWKFENGQDVETPTFAKIIKWVLTSNV